jgi:hypothetical protein
MINDEDEDYLIRTEDEQQNILEPEQVITEESSSPPPPDAINIIQEQQPCNPNPTEIEFVYPAYSIIIYFSIS